MYHLGYSPKYGLVVGCLLHKVQTVVMGHSCLPPLREQCYIICFCLPPEEISAGSLLSCCSHVVLRLGGAGQRGLYYITVT